MGQAALSAYTELRLHIDRGIYPRGQALPGERELSGRLGVSRTTLRAALEALAADGVVAVSARRGWQVTTPVMSEPPSTLRSFTELGRDRGLAVATEILARRVRPSTFDEAEALGLAPSCPVLELERLRRLDGIAVVVTHEVLPAAVAGDLATVDLADQSLFGQLAERGVRVSRSSYTVQAINADAATAQLLSIHPGAAVLQEDEVAYDQSSRPVIVARLRYRGDAYRLHGDLFRPAS
jgi:GntR family transcriptional regulator